MWHYVQKANRDNFLYDLSHIDGESMQYTRYGEGEFYNWHNDSNLPVHYKPQINEAGGGSSFNNQDAHIDYLNIKTELVRKLSFTFSLNL